MTASEVKGQITGNGAITQISPPSASQHVLEPPDYRAMTSHAHLHLQLSDVVHGPRLVVVVIVRNDREAAGSLFRRHAAVWQVLHRTRAPDPVLRDPNGNAGRFKVLTLQNLHIDQVRRLRGGYRSHD